MSAPSENIIAFRPRQTGKFLSGKPEAKPVKAERFEVLDILRGLAMMAMIVVDSPGSWSHLYTQLKHADWVGVHFADLIFPTFLFCVGLSLSQSFERRSVLADNNHLKRHLLVHVWRRASWLILIGLGLNLFPGFDIVHIRIPGVLQRIGLCYGLVASLVLAYSSPGAISGVAGSLKILSKPLAIICVVALMGYSAFLYFVPLPNGVLARFDQAQNWPGFIDQMVLTTTHMWSQGLYQGRITYDPEGLLSTIPACFNVLAGVLVGQYIKQKGLKTAGLDLTLAGFALIMLALSMEAHIPMIKRLWTPSFALFSVSLALFLLASLISLTKRVKLEALYFVPKVFGSNALLAYIMAWIISVVASFSLFSGRSIDDFINASLSFLGRDQNLISLGHAFVMLMVYFLILLPLYLKKWRLKL